MLPQLSESNRIALGLLAGGSLAIVLFIFTGFDLFGTGAWPGVIAIVVGLGRLIWNTARRIDEGDDGAVF